MKNFIWNLSQQRFWTLWRLSKTEWILLKNLWTSDSFQKTIPLVALMGRRSRWRTFSRSLPSARCSPALLVPNAPETLWENGLPVQSAASAMAAPSRNSPITNRRRLVRRAEINKNHKALGIITHHCRVIVVLEPHVKLQTHKSVEKSSAAAE